MYEKGVGSPGRFAAYLKEYHPIHSVSEDTIRGLINWERIPKLHIGKCCNWIRTIVSDILKARLPDIYIYIIVKLALESWYHL